MAVPEQTPYKEYTANGVAKSFELGFICDSKNDLIVLVDGVAPPVATWSLIGANAVFNTAPASGKKIVLQRNTAMSRTTNYQGNNNSFRPETINKDIDRVWLKLQELGVADMLLKIYVDRLHGEQKDYIDNKDQLVRNIITDLRNYVNQQDGSLSSDINNLRTHVNQQDNSLAQSISILRNHTDQLYNNQKNYIDQQDNQRNSYFENLISRQGVSLQQLDSYYNYLMQQLAQVAIDRGWAASFIVSADGSTQQQVNDRIGNTWYAKPLGYELNARVMLTNGDIVKSTTPNNTANPNVDMTGWVPVGEANNLDGIHHLQYDRAMRKDGIQQDPSVYVDALSNKKSIATPTTHYHPIEEMIFDDVSIEYDGNGSRFQATGTRRLFNILNSSRSKTTTARINNTRIDQTWNPEEGSGGSNNNPVIRFRALDNPQAFNNTITGSMGISTSPIHNLGSDYKPTSYAKICFNHFVDMQKQCVEGYGSDHNVIIGNTGDVPLLNSNALRVTGAEPSDTLQAVYNKASVYVGNTFKGGQGEVGVVGKFAAGISVQTRVQGLSASANATQGFRFGVNVKGGTTLENQGRGNYIQSSAVDCDIAVFAEGCRSSQVNMTAYNFKEAGIQEVGGAVGLLSGANKYSGLLVGGAETVGRALQVVSEGNQFNLLIDLRDGGATQRNAIYGKNHSGVISVIGSNDGAIHLYCNDSNLQITVKDVLDTDRTKIAIRVYGSNNTLAVNTKGSLRFEDGAVNNIIFGSVGTAQCTALANGNKLYGYAIATPGFNVNGNTVISQNTIAVEYDPPLIPAGGTAVTTVSLTGANLGDNVNAAYSRYNAALDISCQVSATNTVAIKFKNTSDAVVDLPSGILTVKKV